MGHAALDSCAVAISHRDRVWLPSTRERYARLVRRMLSNVGVVHWIQSHYMDRSEITQQQAEQMLQLVHSLHGLH